MSNHDPAYDAKQFDDYRRFLYAGLQAAQRDSKQLVEDYRNNVAQALLSVGIQLIPSQHLADHQYIVSEGVYAAAKKLAKGAK